MSHDCSKPSTIFHVSLLQNVMEDSDEKKVEAGEMSRDIEANVPSTPISDHPEAGQETENEYEIVAWKEPDDPEKPVNWPTWLRWTLMSLVTAVTFCAGLSSSHLRSRSSSAYVRVSFIK